MKSLRHKNALGDIFYSSEKHEEEMAKIDALNKIANQSSTTSPLIYIIPIAGILVIGVIAAIVLKKKKG